MKKVYIALSADIIHKGHLNIIDEAKKHGSVTVGVLTDEAIAATKDYPFLILSTASLLLKILRELKKLFRNRH